MARSDQYISEVRANAKALWTAWEALKEAQREWNALDYGNTLADGTGSNAGITKAMVGAVAFATADAIETVMNAGNATNVAKLL